MINLKENVTNEIIHSERLGPGREERWKGLGNGMGGS